MGGAKPFAKNRWPPKAPGETRAQKFWPGAPGGEPREEVAFKKGAQLPGKARKPPKGVPKGNLGPKEAVWGKRSPLALPKPPSMPQGTYQAPGRPQGPRAVLPEVARSTVAMVGPMGPPDNHPISNPGSRPGGPWHIWPKGPGPTREPFSAVLSWAAPKG